MSAVCSGRNPAGCRIALTLSTTETIRGGRLIALTASADPTTKRRKLSLGSTVVTLTAGEHRVVRVKLTAAGRRLLARRHRLPATLKIARVAPGGSRQAVHTQTLAFTA